MNALARAFALLIVIAFAFFGGFTFGSPKPMTEVGADDVTFLQKDLGTISWASTIRTQIARLTNPEDVKFDGAGGEYCGSTAAACVDTHPSQYGTIHFASDAFVSGENPRWIDAACDRYIVLHETAHVLLLQKYGTYDAARAAAEAAGFGGHTDRSGKPLSAIEAHAECVAINMEPMLHPLRGGTGGGYIDSCDDFGMILAAFDLIDLDWLEIVEQETRS